MLSIAITVTDSRGITELAEPGVADHDSISGHLSRRMLEHYSHIRIDAGRQALDALDEARRRTSGNGNIGNANDGGGNAGNGDSGGHALARPDRTPEILAVLDVSGPGTSQFTSQSAVERVSALQ